MNKKNIILYVSILLLSVFFAGLSRNYDYDLFARLEVGEIFFKLHTVLKEDPFSYTPTLPWFDHEWGAGVIFYAFLKLFGPAGFILLRGLLYSFVSIIILKYNEKISYPLVIGSFLLFLFQYTAGDLIRCQAFTFVFFCCNYLYT